VRLVINPCFCRLIFNKASDQAVWTFITEMLTCMGFGPICVRTVNTLFSNASTLFLIENTLSILQYCRFISRKRGRGISFFP